MTKIKKKLRMKCSELLFYGKETENLYVGTGEKNIILFSDRDIDAPSPPIFKYTFAFCKSVFIFLHCLFHPICKQGRVHNALCL